MNKPYEPKVRLQYSYFLATITNFRSTPHFIFDCVALIMSITFWYGGLNCLRNKGYIDNYHDYWRIDLEKWF